METIKIKNIRSLAATPEIRLKPITLLVGQNSSGKSTFARLMPLLKQSCEVRTREPFHWLGRLVDFGGVTETRSRFSQSPDLGLEISLNIQENILNGRRRYWYVATETSSESVVLSIDYQFDEDSNEIGSYLYTVKYKNQHITISLKENGEIIKILINGSDYSNTLFSQYVVVSWAGPFPIFEPSEELLEPDENELTDLLKFIRPNFDNRTSEGRANQLALALVSGSITKLRDRALRSEAGDAVWRRKINAWSDSSPSFKKLNDLVLAAQFFNDVGSRIVAQFRRVAIASRYVTPLRASAERYYRLQGLSIEEIDPQGQNIAMFLHNLAPMRREHFSTWMNDFFGFSVETQPIQGHVQLFLNSSSDSSASGFNLADTGFGYSQMLPILVQLWSISSKNQNSKNTANIPLLFSIEQPELHLHPRLQAKLADVFLSAVLAARAIGVELKLIIETHSEQIISRLGLRVAKNPSLASDIGVVIFEKPSMHISTSVRETGFTQDGMLEAWPYGFFDTDE